MSISNRVFDVLKWLAIIGVPALVTLWNVIGETWGLPYVYQISASLTALAVFLGAIVGVSAVTYEQGQLGNAPEESEELEEPQEGLIYGSD